MNAPCMMNSKSQFNHGVLTEMSLESKGTGMLPINRLFSWFNLPWLSVLSCRGVARRAKPDPWLSLVPKR